MRGARGDDREGYVMSELAKLPNVGADDVPVKKFFIDNIPLFFGAKKAVS